MDDNIEKRYIAVCMKSLYSASELIRPLAADMGGVFTSQDLRIILSPKHSNSFVLQIQKLVEAKILQRFARGIYVTKDFDLKVLSQRLAPSSYISFESVLSQHLMIGTQPENHIKAVKLGKRRQYRHPLASIIHLGIAESLFFGFHSKQGVQVADKEKAWLDTLYFYQKGQRFSFSVYSDINTDKLSRPLVQKYLSKYRNPKYRAFALGLL